MTNNNYISDPVVINPDRGFNNANFNNCGGYVSTVGTNGGPSHYGTYDQNGNIDEWTDTTVSYFNKMYLGGNFSTSLGNLNSRSYYSSPSNSSSSIGFRVCSINTTYDYSFFVPVSDINNFATSDGIGSVDYFYSIGTYPITNIEYSDFLNAVASIDRYSLYNINMGTDPNGGIRRTNVSANGTHVYSVIGNMGNKPVNWVNWYSVVRFCNWLHNDRPSGYQDNNTTEDGAYSIRGSIDGMISKNTHAKYWIPTLNEWFKAAYYKGGGINSGYWNYATQYNADIVCVPLSPTRNGPYCYYSNDNVCTPTFTSTATPTITPTNTITPTITSTRTPTPTVTSTITPTITPTVTVTSTVTVTPTRTITPTITITPTTTVTPTMTATSTVTPTITITPTPTLTQTPTQTRIPYTVCGGNLIYNGDFEAGVPVGFVLGGGFADNWIINNVDVANFAELPINRWVDLNSCFAGNIIQTFSTTVGESYVVNFKLAANNVLDLGPKYANVVIFNGNNYDPVVVSQNVIYSGSLYFDSTSHPYDGKYSSMGWIGQSFAFVSSGNPLQVGIVNTSIKFESMTPGTCAGPAIDDVCILPAGMVTPTPTPTITPTNTITPTITPTITLTNTITSTITPTITLTPSITPSSWLAVSAGTNSANFDVCADWDGKDGNVTTVGTNGGPSVYGTYDMTGNLWEINDLDGGVGLRNRIGGSWAANMLSSDISFSLDPAIGGSAIGFRVASLYSTLNPLGLSNFVTVGDINNAADTGGSIGKGSVSYLYSIGKYKVTNNEYKDFLNAIAVNDSYGLYDPNMASANRGGINRSGSNGSFSYSVKINYDNKPVNWVNWFNAARYCNWLHNGKPNGIQDSSTTEDGAYTLNGVTNGNAVARKAGAKYHIPTENEWYKAAYYKGGGTSAGYWKYATQSDEDPTCVSANIYGDGILPQPSLTPTSTPTLTPTPSITSTVTSTPTITPTVTRTQDPTPTVTSTITATTTITTTPTITVTSTVTPTITVTPSPPPPPQLLAMSRDNGSGDTTSFTQVSPYSRAASVVDTDANGLTHYFWTANKDVNVTIQFFFLDQDGSDGSGYVNRTRSGVTSIVASANSNTTNTFSLSLLAGDVIQIYSSERDGSQIFSNVSVTATPVIIKSLSSLPSSAWPCQAWDSGSGYNGSSEATAFRKASLSSYTDGVDNKRLGLSVVNSGKIYMSWTSSSTDSDPNYTDTYIRKNQPFGYVERIRPHDPIVYLSEGATNTGSGSLIIPVVSGDYFSFSVEGNAGNILGLKVWAIENDTSSNYPFLSEPVLLPQTAVGGNATFSYPVSVAVGVPSPTYLWHKASSIVLNSDIYQNQFNYIPGATSSTLNLTGLTYANDNNKYYRCHVNVNINNIRYNIISNIVQLTVPS
jgi:formylglycine-generating enzyme required for sulfatase activity